MNKNDCDFDTWFDALVLNINEQTGVNFRDRESVKDDYNAGRDLFDVADEISAEYTD